MLEESVKMKSFDHPHVISLIGVCVDAGPMPYLIMPYMSQGSLLNYLKKERAELLVSADSDEDEVENTSCAYVLANTMSAAAYDAKFVLI